MHHRAVHPRKSTMGLAVLTMVAALVATPNRAVGDDDKPQSLHALQVELRRAYRAGDYKKALDSAEKILERRPDDPLAMYNVACMNCLLGNKDATYQWLDKAVDAGYDDADFLVNDYDFRTIRGEDRFRAIVRRIREGRGAAKGGGRADDRGAEDHDEERDAHGADRDNQESVGTRIQELTRQLIETAGKKDYDEAIKIALKAHKIAEEHGNTASRSLTKYNVACMYSLMGERDKAFAYLEEVVELGGFGPNLAARIESDEDFSNLRDDPRYKKLLARAKRRPGDGDVEFKYEVTLPKDHKKGRKTPLVVALHSYGGDLDEAVNHWRKAAEAVGAILMTPQGTFRADDGYEWGENIDVVESNVLDAIDEVIDQYSVDEYRIAIGGFSQGGSVAWQLAIRNPETFCGIIPIAGRFHVESEADFDDEDLADLRVCVLIGEDDNDDVIKSNRDGARRFRKLGADVRVEEYADLGHAYPPRTTRELTRALKFVLEK